MLEVKSVTEVSNDIKNILENNIPFVLVEGEISNYKPHYSGHRYFIVKDDYAQINCTMWKSRPLNFNLVDGQKVLITGAISVYPPRGSYNIDVLSILPAGTGDLFQAFELLKQKLDVLGYFDVEKKKPIPAFIMNIGVSTSPTGAAIQDIISTIKRRFPSANIYFRPTIVQGESAPADIVKAIKELTKYPVDVIIVGRGGGSIEDLWSYNTEEVANAIYNCPIPIISAVGHETDFTISDFVADIRAATPTAAAELVTPITQHEMLANLDASMTNVRKNIDREIANIKNILRIYSVDRFYNTIMNRINYTYEKIDNLSDAITKSMRLALKNKVNEINNLENKLIELSPYTPLERGYCLIQKDGKTITNNTSLSDLKTFEIIRKNEKINAIFDSMK